jgi:hypothetical protein
VKEGLSALAVFTLDGCKVVMLHALFEPSRTIVKFMRGEERIGKCHETGYGSRLYISRGIERDEDEDDDHDQ